MSRLTDEQLSELTALINARLDEFDCALMPNLSRGVARVVWDVIGEWQWERRPIETPPNAIALTNGNGNAARRAGDDYVPPKSDEKLTEPPPAVDPVQRRGNGIVPTVDQVIAELKRQSMGGVMPTMAQFDEARPAPWATAAAHLLRFKLSWPELAELAELKPRKPGPVAEVAHDE